MDVCDECHMPWPRPAGEKNICPKCYFYVRDVKVKNAKIKKSLQTDTSAPVKAAHDPRYHDPSLKDWDRAKPKE